MIRYRQSLRLNAKDIQRLTQLTGTSPRGIQTVDGLNRFVDTHRSLFAQETPEARLLELLLLDEKVSLCD